MKHRWKTTLVIVLLFQLFILISLISLTFAFFFYFSVRKVGMLERWYKMMKNQNCETAIVELKPNKQTQEKNKQNFIS